MKTPDTPHWYISGPDSSDYFLLLDEESGHIFAMRLAAHIRDVRETCDEHVDLVTARLPEIWIDDANKRLWYVFENRCANAGTETERSADDVFTLGSRLSARVSNAMKRRA